MFELRGFKLVTTLVFLFKRLEIEGKTKHDNFYSSSRTINEDVIDVYQSIHPTIVSHMQKYLGKASGWIIDSVIDHTSSISK